MTRRCAAAGCDAPVVRRPGQTGRPPIYCTPACRPSRARSGVVVEVEQAEDDIDEAGRDWTVRLRRGGRSMVVHRGLGRFSAAALAAELGQLLGVPSTGAP